jgi:hypothetical protein
MRAAKQPPVDFAPLDAISASLDIADVAFRSLIADSKLSKQDVRRLTERLARNDGEFGQLHEQLQSNQTALRELRSEVMAEANVAKQLREDLQWLRQEADEYGAAKADAELRINLLQVACDQSQSELIILRYKYDDIVTSTTWRALGLIRSAATAVPSPVRRHLRRGLKLLYWIATPQKTRQRLAFLRSRRIGAGLPPSGTTSAGAAPKDGKAAVDSDNGPAATAVDAATPAFGVAVHATLSGPQRPMRPVRSQNLHEEAPPHRRDNQP